MSQVFVKIMANDGLTDVHHNKGFKVIVVEPGQVIEFTQEPEPMVTIDDLSYSVEGNVYLMNSNGKTISHFTPLKKSDSNQWDVEVLNLGNGLLIENKGKIVFCYKLVVIVPIENDLKQLFTLDKKSLPLMKVRIGDLPDPSYKTPIESLYLNKVPLFDFSNDVFFELEDPQYVQNFKIRDDLASFVIYVEDRKDALIQPSKFRLIEDIGRNENLPYRDSVLYTISKFLSDDATYSWNDNQYEYIVFFSHKHKDFVVAKEKK